MDQNGIQYARARSAEDANLSADPLLLGRHLESSEMSPVSGRLVNIPAAGWTDLVSVVLYHKTRLLARLLASVVRCIQG